MGITLLTFLYGIAGIITFLGYFPTIRNLLHGKPSANIRTYAIWTVTMIITFLYALFINKDTLFIVVVGLQMIACIVILFLRISIK